MPPKTNGLVKAENRDMTRNTGIFPSEQFYRRQMILDCFPERDGSNRDVKDWILLNLQARGLHKHKTGWIKKLHCLQRSCIRDRRRGFSSSGEDWDGDPLRHCFCVRILLKQGMRFNNLTSFNPSPF